MSEAAYAQDDTEHEATVFEDKEQGLSFAATAARFNDNIATAALRLVEANQDFVGLIQGFVSAGEALERSLAIHRELGSASQKVLQEAREAAIAAATSASEAREAQASTQGYLHKTETDYGLISNLIDDLQQRISALAMLAAPMTRVREDRDPQSQDDQQQHAEAA